MAHIPCFETPLVRQAIWLPVMEKEFELGELGLLFLAYICVLCLGWVHMLTNRGCCLLLYFILFFIVSFIVFICSECVTYRPNFKMFFPVMVPGLLVYYSILYVRYIFVVCHLIHLLVLVLSVTGWICVFHLKTKAGCFQTVSVCAWW